MRPSLIISLGAAVADQATAQPKAKWFSSTERDLWVQQRDIDGQDPGALPSRLTMTDDRFQSMTGFGACFNELGWIALQTLSEQDRDDVLKKFFSPDELGLTYNRVPIGASDYGNGWYSHNERDGDYSQSNFTVERDEGTLIPYIHAAQRYMKQGSDTQYLFASAWSPPQWMKQNHHYSGCGDDPNALVQTEDMSNSYALYLSKFVTEYGKRGINVTSVMVQNEPYAGGCNYPKCEWTGEEMRDFIKNSFGPLFAKEHGPEALFPSEVWLGTINSGDFKESTEVVYSDAVAAQYVKGVALQWAGANQIGTVHKTWPGLNLIQSENECGDGQNTWDYALDHIFERYHAFITNGARAYVYWNPILDGPSNGSSHWGWKQNSMISTYNSSVVLNPEYYLMKHFSSFVRPGAVRIGVSGQWTKGVGYTCGSPCVMAFISAGEIVVVIANDQKNDRQLTLVASGVAYPTQVEPRSFNTFVLPVSTPCADGFAPYAGDCPGNNYRHVDHATVESCKSLCAEDPACAGFSFNSHEPEVGAGRCYLKSLKCDVATASESSHDYYFWGKCGDVSLV